MANPVVQFQLLSKDPSATAQFYRDLCGWTVGDPDAMGYRRIDTGSAEGIQGGIWPAPPQAGAFAQLFIAVEDARASVSKAESLGAKVLIPPTPLPDGGEVAILQDPVGQPFALWKRKA